jgi:release factor glutamine methyltransferase
LSAPTFDALIQSATERFRGAGVPDARQNAVMLMLGVSGGTRAALIAAGSSPAPEAVRDRFETGVARRLAREPLQHILGTTGFYGLDILTDARALVPRPDSELIVETALALLPAGVGVQVADLGTGSGCLLAAILANVPAARGIGVEASPQAAGLARENFQRLGLAARASVFEGPWSAWTGWGEADLIVSNPPYIPTGILGSLAPEVKDHDPAAALDGGADGLAAYREIIGLARQGMKRGAPLILEIGHDQREAVLGLLAGAGFAELGHSSDLGGNDRCVWGRAS